MVVAIIAGSGANVIPFDGSEKENNAESVFVASSGGGVGEKVRSVRARIGFGDAFDWLASARADAVAVGRDQALSIADEMPGFRVLEDNFMAAEVGIAVPRGRPALLAYVTEFVWQAEASGLVEQSIERLGLRGVRVAPTPRRP